MFDKSKDVVSVFLFMAVFFLFIGSGMFLGKELVAIDCVDYGKTKINGKWYECKLK